MAKYLERRNIEYEVEGDQIKIVNCKNANDILMIKQYCKCSKSKLRYSEYMLSQRETDYEVDIIIKLQKYFKDKSYITSLEYMFDNPSRSEFNKLVLLYTHLEFRDLVKLTCQTGCFDILELLELYQQKYPKNDIDIVWNNFTNVYVVLMNEIVSKTELEDLSINDLLRFIVENN